MEQLRYQPLDHKSGAIRLVRLLPGTDEPIRLELIHSNLDEEPHIPYQALSYVWGPPDEGRAVEIDGQQLTIRRNLSLALLSLRRANEDRILWVDELCINQSDREEKLRQERKLKTIYDRAEKLFRWLADSTPETAQLPALPTMIYGSKVHVVRIGPGSLSWQPGLHQDTQNPLSPVMEHSDKVSCSSGASSPAAAGPSEICCDAEGCVAIFSGMYSKGNLARHKRLKHKGPVVYECEDPSCDRLFQRHDARVKHSRRWHPQLANDYYPRYEARRANRERSSDVLSERPPDILSSEYQPRHEARRRNRRVHREYPGFFRYARLPELLPGSGDNIDLLSGRSGDESQVVLTDNIISRLPRLMTASALQRTVIHTSIRVVIEKNGMT